MKTLKIIFVNFVLLFIMALFTEISFRSYKAITKEDKDDYRRKNWAGRKNVTNEILDWFSDFDQMKKEHIFRYYPNTSYITKAFSSKTINTDRHGFRRTPSHTIVKKNKVHIFGGSTVFGWGVNDNNTIPSIFQRLSGTQTKNFGVMTYRSRQDLNHLLNNFDYIAPHDTVIFYGGLNDALMGCKQKESIHSHSYVDHFNKNLFYKKSWSRLIDQLLSKSMIYTKINQKIQKKKKQFENKCDKEAFESLASELINVWQMTELFLERKNINFICSLQPTPYTNDFKPNYYGENYDEIISQFYFTFKKRIKDTKLNCFLDSTKIFKEDYFIDSCCHTSKEGNEMIAKHLFEEINKRGFINQP